LWMLPSKAMSHIFWLAAPLMDSSIVYWNDSVPTQLLEQLSFLVTSKLYFLDYFIYAL
jgi:hypothetical protein